ncbi:hypothetical protein [Ensifer sp. YR511]|uniref:hypothetical protein n=1 Tax=Ensifer sp. YR511 TaxID=1855294 RepID=UPI00087F3A7B|nr:hypothetical protein [Ensifer sp. YR511]SDO17498.1 hypothetical protein SAMN05216328_16219 [Ensifer sp. YR511]
MGKLSDQRSLGASLLLICFSYVVLSQTADLPAGTLTAMGPAFLPRVLAVFIAIAGSILFVQAFLNPREVIG